MNGKEVLEQIKNAKTGECIIIDEVGIDYKPKNPIYDNSMNSLVRYMRSNHRN